MERALKVIQGCTGIFEIILCCVTLGIQDPDQAGDVISSPQQVTYQQPLLQVQPQVVAYQQPQMVAYQQPQVLQVQQPVEGISGKPPPYPEIA